MKNANILLLRLLLSVFCGSVVTGLALRAGWNSAHHPKGILAFPQRRTQHDIIAINRAIADYRAKNHRLPASLIQLELLLKDSHVYIPNDTDVVDGWYAPFHYTIQGEHYLVTSYGRDNKPGGIGLEADLTSDNPHPPESALTFSWFLSEPDTQGMVLAAWGSGIFTMLLCLQTIKFTMLSRRDIPNLVLAVLILLVATSVTGIVITALHYPSGH